MEYQVLLRSGQLFGLNIVNTFAIYDKPIDN